MLSLASGTSRASFRFEAAREAVVSWNAAVPAGQLELAVRRSDGALSGWLPYASWNGRERRSLGGSDEVAAIAIDVVRAGLPLVGIEVRCDAPLDALAVATPPGGPARARTATRSLVLDVPERSQYLRSHPKERGWCSPAALAMVLAYFGRDRPVAELADAVRDAAYGGTGNWAFNVAAAAAFGLRAAVVYLRDLVSAECFITERFPLALSLAWNAGELPDAPLEASAGHLVVLCGFDDAGNAVCNDPARPSVRVTYQRDAIERAWLGHGGVAYAIVPLSASAQLPDLAAG